MGPMTGRRMGRCTAGNGQGFGAGGGFGRGRGCGRGMGRGGGWAAPAGAYTAATKEDLSLRAKVLEKELEAVKNQLKGLDGQ